MPTAPGQMYTNMVNPAKGWPNPVALDYRAKVSASVLYDMFAGQSVHANTSGQLEPGVVNSQMGLFIFQGVNELDVNTASGTAGGVTQWIPINPSGNILCLVAKGPYELETTEFDKTQTYTINQAVRSPTGNSSGAYASGSGQLTNQSVTLVSQTNTPQSSSTAVCGIVSRPVFSNSYGQKFLPFWPIYCPGRSGET